MKHRNPRAQQVASSKALDTAVEQASSAKTALSIAAQSEEIRSHVAAPVGAGTAAAPGIQMRLRPPSVLQAMELGQTARPERVRRAAEAGVSKASQELPHFGQIQRAFGNHDLSDVRVQVGGDAARKSDALGATAYTTGNRVAFKSSPDLHTAAHEAAHVVQQRGGVQLSGGVGQAGDKYEDHADSVANLVVQGKSAEGLLGRHSGPQASRGATTAAVQAKRVNPKTVGVLKEVSSDGNRLDFVPAEDIHLDWRVKTNRGLFGTSYSVDVQDLRALASILFQPHPKSNDKVVPNTVDTRSNPGNLVFDGDDEDALGMAVDQHPCYWKKARWEMMSYYIQQPSGGRKWHSTEVAKQHELAHFNIDLPRFFGEADWSWYNKELDKLKTSAPANPEEAKTALAPQVTELLNSFKEKVAEISADFINAYDMPPVANLDKSSGYKAGWEVMQAMIAEFDAFARTKQGDGADVDVEGTTQEQAGLIQDALDYLGERTRHLLDNTVGNDFAEDLVWKTRTFNGAVRGASPNKVKVLTKEFNKFKTLIQRLQKIDGRRTKTPEQAAAKQAQIDEIKTVMSLSGFWNSGNEYRDELDKARFHPDYK